MRANGKATDGSRGAGEKLHKRPVRPEINEEPQNVSQEAGQDNSTGVLKLSTHKGGDIASISATIGMSELEQILKHKTFTRSEIQRLIELLHSRISEESPRVEASTSGNFNAAIVRSKVPLVEQAYYKGSTIGTGQAPRQDLKLINNNAKCLSKTPTTSSQDPASIKYLPNEILTNIFVRLLAKQLAQMRAVSKSWNALLSDSSFIKSHLHHSTHNKDQVLLVFYNTSSSSSSSSDYKQFTALPCRSPHLELTNFIKLPPMNPQSRFNGIRIIGSVKGLICSSYGPNSVIHIWNPSLSSVLTLPPYSTPSDGCLRTHFRFGYDPETNDYKVVILPSLIRPHTYAGKWWLQIEIYSMRKGSWKWITQEVPSYITCVTDVDKTCVDGHDGRIHWLGYTKKDDLLAFERIVAFDLGSETFREIPMPDSIPDGTCENTLGVLAKKLCVMSHDRYNGTCEVWVMDESWVKRHVFSRFSCYVYIFGFTSQNEFLTEDIGRLVLYDPSTNKEKLLEDHYPRENDPKKIIEYVDSLVWVSRAQQKKAGWGRTNLKWRDFEHDAQFLN